jgi:cleavage and polyadenylation specificity factor subunit 1
MQCYTELCPPTAVSHSISLPFTSSKTTNLIVAKTSLLQIFDFKAIVTEAASNKSGDNDVLQDLGPDAQDFTGDMTLQKLEYTTKLLLLGEYPLSGTVSSLGRVKILNSKLGTEALLVAFRDAKISLVQWNQERNTISTVSIH